jgi:hypothetical protein
MRWPPREDVPAWVVALLERVSAGGVALDVSLGKRRRAVGAFG